MSPIKTKVIIVKHEKITAWIYWKRAIKSGNKKFIFKRDIDVPFDFCTMIAAAKNKRRL